MESEEESLKITKIHLSLSCLISVRGSRAPGPDFLFPPVGARFSFFVFEDNLLAQRLLNVAAHKYLSAKVRVVGENALELALFFYYC